MISIIIPCYNEQNNIKHLFFKAITVSQILKDAEFIFVNNGSSDDTLTELYSNKSTCKNINIKIVNIQTNLGYGNGILKGILEASHAVIAWTHADLQTDLEDIVIGYNLYLSENNNLCVVKGNRINRPFFDIIFTKSMEFFVFIFTNIYLHDINAQPKIFSKEFFTTIYNDKIPLDFSFDLYFLYHAKKIGYIKSFNVNFNKREFDTSKGGGTLYGKYILTKRTFKYLFKFIK